VVKSRNLGQEISAGQAGIALTIELTLGWWEDISLAKESLLQKYKYCLCISEMGLCVCFLIV
jgi:hypothetical protein